LTGKFDVDAVEQHDRGDKEFAAGDAHDRGDDPDGEPGGKASHGPGDAGEGEGVCCSVGAKPEM
jgi:hypothetical protein